MHIRPAVEADALAIARVHVDSWQATYADILPADYLAGLSVERRENFWRSLLADPNATSWVYVAHDEETGIIGFASGGPERTGDPLYRGELHAIYLRADFQGKGIGRQLTVAIVDRLLEESLSSMLVWVFDRNPACAFYEALGGERVYEKTVIMGDAALKEIAYGWRDIRPLSRRHRA